MAVDREIVNVMNVITGMQVVWVRCGKNRNTRKVLAGRFYQFFSGHANVGSYLGTIDDDRCWHCGAGEQQTRFHLIARCLAWRGQARVMWRRIEKLCEWEEPKTPEARLLFGNMHLPGQCLPFCETRG